MYLLSTFPFQPFVIQFHFKTSLKEENSEHASYNVWHHCTGNAISVFILMFLNIGMVFLCSVVWFWWFCFLREYNGFVSRKSCQIKWKFYFYSFSLVQWRKVFKYGIQSDFLMTVIISFDLFWYSLSCCSLFKLLKVWIISALCVQKFLLIKCKDVYSFVELKYKDEYDAFNIYIIYIRSKTVKVAQLKF